MFDDYTNPNTTDISGTLLFNSETQLQPTSDSGYGSHTVSFSGGGSEVRSADGNRDFQFNLSELGELSSALARQRTQGSQAWWLQ